LRPIVRHRVASLWALALVPTLEAAAPPRYDIPYSTEVVTPHVPWATTLREGPIRGFFIPPVARGRDMVELMQRLALAPTTVTIDRNWDVNCWGIGDFYGHEFRGDRDDFGTVYGYVEAELTSDKRFEVMLVPGLNGWSRLTRASRDAISRRVREGAGLVLLHPFLGDVKGHPFKGDEAEPDRRLWDLSPLVGVPDDFVSERGYPEPNTAAIREARWERGTPHAITEGVALELVQSGRAGGRFYEYEPRGDVLVRGGEHPILAVKRHGKGRVAAFAYVEDGFLPETVDPAESKTYWPYWEYQYALLVRTLLWASGRQEGVSLEAPALSADGGGVELRLRSEEPAEVEIEVGGRGEFGASFGTTRVRRSLGRGSQALAVSLDDVKPKEGWPGGRAILDVVVRDARGGFTLDFGSLTFVTPKRATVTAVRPGAEVYREGDTLSVVTRAAGDLRGLTMRLEVRDDLDRLLHAEERATAGEKAFVYRLDDFVGNRAFVRASLVEGGRLVDELRARPVSVVQRARRGKEYQGLLSFEEPRPFLASLQKRRLRAQAMDSGFTWGGKVNDSLDVPRGWFGVYWYDRGPTTPEGLERAIREYEATSDFASLQYLTKKELYRRTGDKRFLVRSPSLDDPEVLRTLADVARAAARNKAVYNMDYYFVGDEGSLTSYTDPVDFCFGPHTLTRFRAWLQEQYGSLAGLNRSWRSDHRDWDAVWPATTEEAQRSGVFPPWADHRTYMEVSFANAYRVVREAVVEGDPEGRIALSGTQVTTPWNGADWARLDQVVDDFLSYDGGNQWDLHRSFAKPGARVGFWTGYGRHGMGVRHEIWSAALQGVLFPNLFWSHSVVNPDLTFSASGRDMGSVFQALRFEGIGKLLMEAERLDDGVLLHYSMASVHAAGILGFHDRARKDEDAHPGFPANRDGWVKALTDLGLSFRFVSSPQIEAGALDPSRHKVLVLPLSLALSAREAQAIEAFARAGGIVIADAAAGLLDEHCAWVQEGALSGLFGVVGPPSERRTLATPRASGPLTVTEEGRAWGLDAERLAGLPALESNVEPKGSQPLVSVGGVPAVFARPSGKGWALYLNALFDRYPKERTKGYEGAGYRSVLTSLLGRLRVRPAVSVVDARGRPVGPARVARYRFGSDEILGVLLEPSDVLASHGRDGVTVYDDRHPGRVARQEVEVRLPRTAEVVNARTGESLGRTDRVRTTVVAGDALVLAVSDARPALSLAGPGSARRGEHPRLSVVSSGVGRRLVRCHVLGPDGGFRPEYSRNLLLEGRDTEMVLASALDDPAGVFRVRCRDVVAGTAAEIAVDLR
jgi:hypothetical protein